ncbi:hypothetical protein Tco_0036031, partial [Tanacetum coccineum]
MPPTPDLSFAGLEEFTSEHVVIKHVVENSKAKASEAKPVAVRKNNGAPIIKDGVSDSEEEYVPQAKIEKKQQNISKIAVSVNTARQVNTAHSKTTVNAARPMLYLSETAHSAVKRPINKNTSFKNRNFNQRVNTVKDKNVNTVRPKAVVNTGRPKVVVNAVKGNNVNVVKASACWVWKPKTKVLVHVSKHISASITLNKFDYVDAQGRS